MKIQIHENGDKFWLNDKGEEHNITGPAIIWADGMKVWRRNGLSHRLDGPADFIGDYKYWCWLGKDISEQHHTLVSNIKFFTRRVQI